MSDYKQQDNTGALFSNAEKVKENKDAPKYTGSAMVNGKTMRVAMWLNESKKGVKFWGLKFNEPQPKTDTGHTFTSTTTQDTEIPF